MFYINLQTSCICDSLFYLHSDGWALQTFNRKLLTAMTNIELKRRSGNPCIYYKRKEGRLAIVISWINDNMILGPVDLVMELKADLMKQFECNSCGVLTE
jgi:hypothetical protein